MSKPHHDQLLHDLLSDGMDSPAESRSLENLLADARRLRRQRRVTRYGLSSLLALALLAPIALSLSRSKHAHTAAPATVASVPVPSSISPAAAPIRTVTDEELFALFPGRQLALIGPPGNQRLVFLDGP